MSDSALGKIGWIDLTVSHADSVSQFYQAVAGWTRSAVDMEGYQDFCMHPPGADSPVAGICHARGNNIGLPAQWLMYITVANLAPRAKANLPSSVIQREPFARCINPAEAPDARYAET
jgi:uncharacterized protein